MEILTKNQVALLELIGKEKYLTNNFFLTGGTALAAFYLNHRLSEDLDFFSEKEVDTSILNVFFKKHRKILGITKIDFEQSYNRNLYFLHFANEVLKTEFTYFPFPRFEIGKKEHGVTLESLEDIAVNKLFTIYQRTKARDYIDLYCICKLKGYKISDLIKQAKQKFDWHIDPIQLGTQFIKAQDAPDLPKMLIDLKLDEWQSFFISEAKKLKKDILI